MRGKKKQKFCFKAVRREFIERQKVMQAIRRETAVTERAFTPTEQSPSAAYRRIRSGITGKLNAVIEMTKSISATGRNSQALKT